MLSSCPLCRSRFTLPAWRIHRAKMVFCSRECRYAWPLSAQAFWLSVARAGEDDCWLWQGRRTPNGYGQTVHVGRRVHAHRRAFILSGGRISAWSHVHHLCGVCACCNPKHLVAVSPKRHTTDLTPASVTYRNKRKSYCVHGHPLTPENAYVWRGHRQCRACKRDHDIMKRQSQSAHRAHRAS